MGVTSGLGWHALAVVLRHSERREASQVRRTANGNMGTEPKNLFTSETLLTSHFSLGILIS